MKSLVMVLMTCPPKKSRPPNSELMLYEHIELDSLESAENSEVRWKKLPVRIWSRSNESVKSEMEYQVQVHFLSSYAFRLIKRNATLMSRELLEKLFFSELI